MSERLLGGTAFVQENTFRELLRVDRGETPRAGLAAGKTAQATAKLLISHHERDFGGAGGRGARGRREREEADSRIPRRGVGWGHKPELV